MVFFFTQKTAYVIRISDWSSDVCSSELVQGAAATAGGGVRGRRAQQPAADRDRPQRRRQPGRGPAADPGVVRAWRLRRHGAGGPDHAGPGRPVRPGAPPVAAAAGLRRHTGLAGGGAVPVPAAVHRSTYLSAGARAVAAVPGRVPLRLAA